MFLLCWCLHLLRNTQEQPFFLPKNNYIFAQVLEKLYFASQISSVWQQCWSLVSAVIQHCSFLSRSQRCSPVPGDEPILTLHSRVKSEAVWIDLVEGRLWAAFLVSHWCPFHIFPMCLISRRMKLGIPCWKCESRHGCPGPERGQRGSAWGVLAVGLFIQHIILMSVTPTTFSGEQSSVITEALLLIYNLSVALLADPCNSSTCRRDPLSPTYQAASPLFWHGTHFSSELLLRIQLDYFSSQGLLYCILYLFVSFLLWWSSL